MLLILILTTFIIMSKIFVFSKIDYNFNNKAKDIIFSQQY
jgi:hypothetical protein